MNRRATCRKHGKEKNHNDNIAGVFGKWKIKFDILHSMQSNEYTRESIWKAVHKKHEMQEI